MAAKDKGRKKVPSFRDRQRFPESSSPYKQLRLLIQGSMPLLHSKMRAVVYRIRSLLADIAARLHVISLPRRAHTALFLAGSLAIAVFAVFNALYTTGTTVTLDGVTLATVASQEEAEAAKLSVERSISDVVGYDYTLEDSQVSYSTGLTYRSAVVDESKLEEALSDSLRMVEHGYALYVDGEMVGATQTEGALEELLEQVAAPYRNENTVSIDFVEDIEIKECDLPVDQFTNLADVALLLNSSKAGEVTYTVEAGDCWSVIAQDHDMTNSELLKLKDRKSVV